MRQCASLNANLQCDGSKHMEGGSGGAHEEKEDEDEGGGRGGPLGEVEVEGGVVSGTLVGVVVEGVVGSGASSGVKEAQTMDWWDMVDNEPFHLLKSWSNEEGDVARGMQGRLHRSRMALP